MAQPGLVDWLHRIPVATLPPHSVNLLLYALCLHVRPLPADAMRSLLLIPGLARRTGVCPCAVPPVLTANPVHARAVVNAAQLEAQGLLARLQSVMHPLRLAHRSMVEPAVPCAGRSRRGLTVVRWRCATWFGLLSLYLAANGDLVALRPGS